jgi:hypothetical protein
MFFVRNTSADFFFSEPNQTIAPHEDIRKVIELDEQI